MRSRIAMIAVLAAMPFFARASLFSDDAPTPDAVAAQGTAFFPVFAPNIASSVVAEIAGAQKSVRVAARLFVSKSVSEALVNARRAGRDVEIMLDRKSNATGYSAANFLFTMGVIPRTAEGLYETYVIIDGREVILGDISSLPEKEDEQSNHVNVLIIRAAPDLAKRYEAQWQTLWNASEEMKRNTKD